MKMCMQNSTKSAGPKERLFVKRYGTRNIGDEYEK